MKTFARKLKTGGGFTISEVLIVVAILVMITAGLMPAAMNAYQKAIDAANAHALLTEVVNTLRGELSTARDVNVTDNTTITYMSAGTGGQSKIYLDDNVIMIQDYGEYDRTDVLSAPLASKIFDYGAVAAATPSPGPLISDAMTKQTSRVAEQMTVLYTEAELEEDCITITGLHVSRGNAANASSVAQIDELVIRTLGGEQP